MRILLYNFLQPDEHGAGGVGVYINNLANALAAGGYDVVALSSGSEYSAVRRDAYVRFSRDRYDRAVITNSPVVAPALYSFDDPASYTSSDKLDRVPDLLRAKYGNIDVFHFHNLEGLTASFFKEVRKTFPASRMVFSVHNYHAVCPRVSLWYQDRVVCEDYREGVACTMCEAPQFDLKKVRATLRLRTLKKRHPVAGRVVASGLPLLKRVRGLARGGPGRRGDVHKKESYEVTSSVPADFRVFRQANVALLGTIFDHVLAVSDRTRDIMVRYGVRHEKVAVSYIGTAHKERFLKSGRITDIGEGLHICYMGYMWRNKGFELLLDSLEEMSPALASGISVTVAAKNTNDEWLARVRGLAPKFRMLRYFDGYTHHNIDEVLEGVNLGVVPVLWEDNLPQIAIELVSRGIPILTSDRGGAREIAHNGTFVFRAESRGDFVERLSLISRREVSLEEFWDGDMILFSMEEHVRDLAQYYRDAGGGG